MPTYHELVLRYGPDRKDYVLRLYRQPLHRHVIAQGYHRWTRMTAPVAKIIEEPLRRRHESDCAGCEVGYRKDGKRVLVCGYIPLTNRQDLRMHELDQAGRGDEVEIDVDEDVARRLGWRGPGLP